MKTVSIKNRQLLKTLNEYKEVIFALPKEERDLKLPYPKFEGEMNKDIACSHEYLAERMQKRDIATAYPRHSKGFDINISRNDDVPAGWIEAAKNLDDGIMSSIGIGFSALKMYYPEDGYIGWHNNCNCPGENLLLTYSEGGDGYFEWMDPVSKEIVRIPDQPGWTAKVGYYGNENEHDKIIWHCAKTNEPRITVSYVVRDQSMWEDMVADIQSDQ